MNLLLINTNPAVSRLIKLSSDKYGFNTEEVASIEEASSTQYNIVFIDSDLFSEETLETVRANFQMQRVILIASKGSSVTADVEGVLEKPFLPTDFVDLVKKGDQIEEASESFEEIPESHELADDGLDFEADAGLDGLESLELEDDSLDSIEGLDDDLSLDISDDALADLGDESAALDDDLDDFGKDVLDIKMDLEAEEDGADDALIAEDAFDIDDTPPLEEEATSDEVSDDFDLDGLDDFEDDSHQQDALIDDAMQATQEEPLEETPASGVLDEEDIQEVKDLLDDDIPEGDDDLIAEDDLMLETNSDEIDFGDALLDEQTAPLDDEEISLDSSLDLEEPVEDDALLEENDLDVSLDEEDASLDTLDEDETLDLEDDLLAEGDTDEQIQEEDEFALEEENNLDLEGIDDIDMEDDVKIKSDEFASLAEEAVAEALGEEIEGFDDDMIEEDHEAIEDFIDEEDEPSEDEEDDENEEDQSISPAVEVSNATSNIAASALGAGLIDAQTLKEALLGLQINISISFDEKK